MKFKNYINISETNKNTGTDDKWWKITDSSLHLNIIICAAGFINKK